MDDKVSRKVSSLAVNSDAWKPLKGAALLWAQFKALTKKNFVIRGRAWKMNLLLITQAAMFIILTWIVDRAVFISNQRRPAFSSVKEAVPVAVGGIPLCSDNMFMRIDEPCYTLLYTPKGVDMIDNLMKGVAQSNIPEIPLNQVRSFVNGSTMDEYLLKHPNTVIAAVEFAMDSPTSIGFSIQTNSSVQWFKGRFQDPNLYAQLPVQVAVERQIFKLIAQQPEVTWDVSVTPFPHPSSKSPSAIANFAPTFIFASMAFNFVIQLHDLLHEKESGARRLMSVMGLANAPFFASWILFQSLLAVIEACLLVGFSYAFSFDLFVRNDFRLSSLLLLEVALAMSSFAFFVAAFLRKAQASVAVGFLLFIAAWVCLVVLRFGFPYRPQYPDMARLVFSAFPWNLLGKGIDDLASAASGIRGGLAWADRFAYCQTDIPSPQLQQTLSFWVKDCVTPLGEIYWLLAIQIVGYLVLAIYLDNVLPGVNGTRKPVWYFLQPSYWLPSKRPNLRKAEAAMTAMTSTEEVEDVDVRTARDEMKVRCEAYIKRQKKQGEPEVTERKFAIEMFALRKTYKARGLFSKKRVFTAVAGNSFGIREGECFCLLGPNGAGKTTSIHCLTGVLPFSEGDALIYGTSIATSYGLDQIRPLMGVCPQFDTGLWELLSGREHLHLFGSIKGIPASAISSESARLLEDVKLTEAADITAGAYSGGMKRRLSVALALLGNPKIVYLDEPTTGLDPISRRHLWDLIDSAKQNRAIVLTTHSMEEADILGDRIGIMVRGKLQCVGTSLRLKSRFGSGYRVSVRVHAGVSNFEDQKTRIKSLFMTRLGVKSVDETQDYVHFLVPYENEDRLPLMLAHVKSHAKQLGVADIQLRLTPLEEVFLNVARKAELQHAEAEGRFETLLLTEENIAIKVPIGADFIQSPAGHFYHVKWVQDETGELKMKDYWRDPLNSKLHLAKPSPNKIEKQSSH